METDFENFRRKELRERATSGETMSLRVSIDFRRELEARAMELGATKSQFVRYLLTKGFENQFGEVNS